MPSEALFDPCKQWLGIDAVDLGKARLVLGVAPAESDPAVVARAAEARLNLLKAIAPGPFELARASLMKRVEEAREKVLAEIAAGIPGPVRTAADGFAMPAPPSQLASVTPPPTASTQPFSSLPPGPALPPPVPGASGGAEDGFGTISIRTTVYRKKTPVAGIALSLLALAALAGGLAYYKFVVSDHRQPAKQGRRKDNQRLLAQQEKGVADQEREGESGTREPVSREDRERQRLEREQREREQQQQAARNELERQRRERDEQVQKPAVKPAMERPQDRPEPASEDGNPGDPERESESRSGQGTRTDSMPDQRQAGQFEGTLAEVFAAMRPPTGRPDDAAIADLLDTAAGQAGGDEAKKRVASWRALARFHKGFLDYRDQAIADVKAGEEYDYKDRKFAIIEIDDQVVKVRDQGQKKTLNRDDLPAGIVLAIVTSWFDKKPANDLYLGAYHFVKPEPNAQLAREHWEKAEARGADASELMPLLDDPVFTRAIEQDGRE